MVVAMMKMVTMVGKTLEPMWVGPGVDAALRESLPATLGSH